MTDPDPLGIGVDEVDVAQIDGPPPTFISSVTTATATVPAATDLTDIVDQTLRFLADQVPMGLWMFTRVQDDDWIVLQTVGDGYDIRAGQVLRWEDSFCSRMVHGRGPRSSNNIAAVPVYRDAPVAQQIPIGRYCGQPITVADAGLFGTLCGIDPAVADADLEDAEPLVRYAAEMISSALSADLRHDRLKHQLAKAEVAARTDPLTGLANRRAFEHMLTVEESRSRRYGHSVGIAMLDLNELKATNDRDGHAAGDLLISRTATALTTTLRAGDLAFRIGGDEFAIIAAPVGTQAMAGMTARIRAALAAAGVNAAVGIAVQGSGQPLKAAVALADERMYADKTARS